MTHVLQCIPRAKVSSFYIIGDHYSGMKYYIFCLLHLIQKLLLLPSLLTKWYVIFSCWSFQEIMWQRLFRNICTIQFWYCIENDLSWWIFKWEYSVLKTNAIHYNKYGVCYQMFYGDSFMSIDTIYHTISSFMSRAFNFWLHFIFK